MSAEMLILFIGGIHMNTKTRRVLTIKEAAQLIEGLTEYRIRQMCISGQLPCFMAGKKYLISEDTLMKVVFGHYEPEGGDAA
jgi:excisionase family DNA binding protein